MYINKLANLQRYKWSIRNEAIEVVLYSLAGFFLPFMLAHPQWLVGTIVNAMIISAAMSVKGHKLLPVIMLPSLGVLAAGLIFEQFTPFLLYMIAFIWIGNSLLIGTFKFLNIHKKRDYSSTLIIGAAVKSIFLFIAAFVMFKFGLLPVVFLSAMGIMQWITVISGGALAFGFEKIKAKIS